MKSVDMARHAELSAEGLRAIGARNACDREFIHLSGAIQPHGFLLVVDPISWVVIAASANAAHLAGFDGSLIGVALSRAFGDEFADTVRALRPTGNPHDALPTRVRLTTTQRGRDSTFAMVAHRTGLTLVLEFEPGWETDDAAFALFFQRQREAVKTLLTLDDVETLCQSTVQELQLQSGYDRVMIYRFDRDAHGEVIAEARGKEAESYLRLHYPAGDIPRQARVLYMRNWIRVIADVDYAPIPIEALVDGPRIDQLDLSMSVLRGVSPIHLQYLRNMGVKATMTISLIVDNQLWGMIACHHNSAKRVSHSHRLAYEALGQLLSVRLRAVESAKHHENVRNLGQLAAQVANAVVAAENAAAGIAAAAAPLLSMVAADGAVVEIDGVRITAGIVPSDQLLDLLAPRLAKLAGAGVVPIAIESLRDLGISEIDHVANAFAVAGALFAPLPGRLQGFLLWLRCERARTVRWAGQPTGKSDAEDAAMTLPLTPRASFAEWREEVRGYCAPWQAWEIAAAAELTQAMPEVMQHRAQNRLVRMALHDPLTGLPNRRQLHDQLDKWLRVDEPRSEAEDEERQLGVLFIDVDGFKAINDTQGHQIGDELLIIVARRICSLIRPQDIAARLGGDEFVVLVPNTNILELAGIAQRIVDDLRLSFALGGQTRPGLPVSIGVALVPKGTERGEALRQADAAMYRAKRSGRDQIAIYDAALGAAVGRKQTAEKELRLAIEADEITVHYQPIFELVADGPPLLDGFEALARWRHPTRGLLSPDQFIGLAEETGLIDALGDAVMLKALRQLQAWPDRRLSMAINVSVRQFLRPAFAAKVISRLVEFGIEPHRLCLEITESQMMENPRRALAILAELRAAGTEIAIDDFGTGFSSMAYVRDLPATLLKIDKLFVAGLPHSPRDVAVVTAILQLAHSLGMRTVAEGVETVEQLATLRELGSNFAQGYLLGRPLPPEKIIIPARVSIS